MKNELDLIQKAKSGDTYAFEEIVNKYKNYIFAIILNFIKEKDEAENVMQEVFLQIYISLPKYKNDNFKGWISRMTSNKSIDYIRKKKSKFKEEVVEIREDQMYHEEHTKGDMPDEILIQKEKNIEISNLCSSIPKIYEDSIRKFYLEGKSYEEIALEEEVTVKTIASRIYRGKNMLREKWREKDETLWWSRMETL